MQDLGCTGSCDNFYHVLFRTPIEGLYATPPEPLVFDPSVSVRGYLLQRADGNMLVYNAPSLAAAAADIDARGGAAQHFVNHSHEAMFGPQGIDVGVQVHERDSVEPARSLPVAGTFSQRRMITQDFAVIPIPGHTPGATAFLWDTGQHRLLFTGDSLWLDHDDWSAVVLPSSDRPAYLESLAALRDEDFDVLVPWGATAGRPSVAVVTPAEARRNLDAVIARLLRGEHR